MDFFSKLKEQIKKVNFQKLNLNSKLVTNLLIVLAVGIVFILISDFYSDIKVGGTQNNASQTMDTENSIESTNDNIDYVTALENRLKDILSDIQDAGRVSVMITLKTGNEIIPAMNRSKSDKTTNENDQEGGTRIINEESTSEDIIIVDKPGDVSQSLVLKEINPEINGVIIVAEGAKNPKVKLLLTEAVQTVLDIPAYKISVFQSGK